MARTDQTQSFRPVALSVASDQNLPFAKVKAEGQQSALISVIPNPSDLNRKPPFVRASKRGGAVHSLLADCLRVPSISSISHTFWRANMASLRAAISRSCFWPTDGLIHAKKPVGMPH
jgi:hypothetical protein